jgi:hypothetical protein
MKGLFDKWRVRMWTEFVSFRNVSSNRFYSEYSNDTKVTIKKRMFIIFAIIMFSKSLCSLLLAIGIFIAVTLGTPLLCIRIFKPNSILGCRKVLINLGNLFVFLDNFLFFLNATHRRY